MKLAWVTDPHFDFFPKRYPAQFGRYAAETYAPDAILFTGDIATADSFSLVLIGVAEGFGKPVYFVLGNHDYYGQSFANAEDKAERLSRKHALITWLTKSDLVTLTPGVALVGNEGWYDCRWGYTDPVRVDMGDFSRIKDLNRFWRLQASPAAVRRALIIEHCQARAALLADEAEKALRHALVSHEHALFATHIPPFPQNASYHGADKPTHQDDREWLPWYTDKAMGDMLTRVADDHPDRSITTLCGHAHWDHDHTVFPNLRVRTGPACYGKRPQVTILDL